MHVNQAYDPKRGYRWKILVNGRQKIIWARDAKAAANAARLLAPPDADIGRPEPATADWRSARRGGSKTRQIGVRVTEDQYRTLQAMWRRSGTPRFSEWLLERLLRGAADIETG
jgi:hypothetical protein